MTVLLKDALMPNLVQTLENNPVFIHGGPFANIAHGCNSVLATKSALKIADYVVTEAGFGADLGAEKFFDIKCRKAGLSPGCGGRRRHRARAENARRRLQGEPQERERARRRTRAARTSSGTLQNMAKFGVPVAVAINKFVTDTDAEMQEVMKAAESLGARAFVCTHWADGGAGTEQLARHVVELTETTRSNFKPLYPDNMTLRDKVKTIATEIYGASDIACDASVETAFKDLEAGGFGNLPVCMAKTQYSFSTDPTKRGAPTRARRAGARAASVGRRRVRRRHHRRDHDHAGPAARAGVGGDPPQRRGPDRRPVLTQRSKTAQVRCRFSRQMLATKAAFGVRFAATSLSLRA